MRNMQKMWEDYAKEVQVLRERIAELGGLAAGQDNGTAGTAGTGGTETSAE